MFDFTKVHTPPKQVQKPPKLWDIRSRDGDQDEELPPPDPNVKPERIDSDTIKVGDHIIKTSSSKPEGMYDPMSEMGLEFDDKGQPIRATGQVRAKPEEDK